MEWMTQRMPVVADLIAAVMLALVYTGTHAVVTDMSKALSLTLNDNDRALIQRAWAEVTSTRAVALLAAAGMLVLYFIKYQMPGWGGLVVGFFWLSSMSTLAKARQTVDNARVG